MPKQRNRNRLSLLKAQFHRWAFLCPAATHWAMEPMQINVISAREVNGSVKAVVRADNPPRAVLHLVLKFPLNAPMDVWKAARDEALRYLDVS